MPLSVIYSRKILNMDAIGSHPVSVRVSPVKLRVRPVCGILICNFQCPELIRIDLKITFILKPRVGASIQFHNHTPILH